MTNVPPERATVEQQLLLERVRLIYRQARTGSIGNMLMAVVCGAWGWGAGLRWFSVLPFVGVLAVYSVRLALVGQFTRDETRRTVTQWKGLVLRNSLASGVCWGLGALATFPWASPEWTVILTIIAIGLTAAGLATLAPVRAVYLLYLVPFFVGLIGATALFFPFYPRLMAGLLGFYVLVMRRASQEQVDTIERSLRLAIENRALVDELVRAKERAEEARAVAEVASESKSQFLARMSHEIRTPLNGILGVHELLLTSALGPDERRFIETAHQAGRSLLSIINDVLDFSKIEAGKVALDEAPFKVERLLEELMTLFGIAAHRKGLQLSYELDERVPMQLVGDELRLRQVLTNLMGNALKFTAQGEVALLVSAGVEGQVRFAVKDTGIGISAAQRNRIFKSFEQADGSIARRFGGTGLGLAISRQLVALMGGNLEVASEAGSGSEFFFTLPLPRAVNAPKEQVEVFGAGRRAVVVVRYARARTNLVRWLSAAGFRVEAHEPNAVLPNLAGVGLLVLDEGGGGEPVPPRGVPTLVCEQTLSLGSSEGKRGQVARVPAPLLSSVVLGSVRRVLQGEAASGTDAAQRRQWGNARVLVVDDDAVNRTIAQAMLVRLGCSPLALANGRGALEALDREPFDLVLMDCEMPEFDGLDTTREVRRREGERAGKHVPVVALTGHATEVQRARCLDAGMDEMVTKPISLAALESCLSTWVPAQTA